MARWHPSVAKGKRVHRRRRADNTLPQGRAVRPPPGGFFHLALAGWPTAADKTEKKELIAIEGFGWGFFLFSSDVVLRVKEDARVGRGVVCKCHLGSLGVVSSFFKWSAAERKRRSIIHQRLQFGGNEGLR